MFKKTNIKKATAVYSGGNIYAYYGELENGNWIMGNDFFLVVVNTNPLSDYETYEQSEHYEWQKKHLVKEIKEKYYQKTLDDLLDVIFKGCTIEEYDNFFIGDLEKRYKL